MEFNQSECESLVSSLQAREEKILFVMQQLFEAIPEETKKSRVEKHLNEIYDGWTALQETRLLKKRIQRTIGKGKPEGKAESPNVRTLNQPG
ncbi:hypothetical protein [Salinithrix halophila]|uniref:Uncharacterized protein n=1 Tax=Salinithrix halophila TaxID=1485204 RepID=A0ABV8JH99_9BACL